MYKGQEGSHTKLALKRFCLSIKKGEMFGLIGPNGAGKTTLISILTGLYEADKGTALINGIDIKENPDLVHLNIGVCP